MEWTSVTDDTSLSAIFFPFRSVKEAWNKRECSCRLQLYLVHGSFVLKKNSVAIVKMRCTKKKLCEIGNSSSIKQIGLISTEKNHRATLPQCYVNLLLVASEHDRHHYFLFRSLACSPKQGAQLQQQYNGLSTLQIIKNSLHCTFDYTFKLTVQTIELCNYSHTIHKFTCLPWANQTLLAYSSAPGNQKCKFHLRKHKLTLACYNGPGKLFSFLFVNVAPF